MISNTRNINILHIKAKYDISDFIKSIDESKYNPLIVDGTQKNYNSIIKLKLYSEDILKKYDEKFKLFLIPEIRDMERDIIFNKFNKVINEGLTNSMKIANEELNEVYKNKLNIYKFIEFDIRKDLKITYYYELQECINSTPWLDIVKIIFMEQLQEKINIINDKIEEYYNQYRTKYDNYITKQCTIIKNFINNKETLFTFIPDIKLSFENIVNNYVNDFYKYNLDILYFNIPKIMINIESYITICGLKKYNKDLILLDITNKLNLETPDILTEITNKLLLYKNEFTEKRTIFKLE